MLSLKNINKYYNNNIILDGISFKANPSEIVCILGASGCGKTTLLNILSGLDTDFKGEISKHETTGFLFQDRELLPWRTILENTTLGLDLKNISNSNSINKAKDILKNFGLNSVLDVYPSKISGGMKRRVAFAQTLALNPDLLLLDEPLTGLDINARKLVSQQIKNYIQKNKAVSVIVTHSIEEAIFLADRIIILSANPAKVCCNISKKDFDNKDSFNYILNEFTKYNPIDTLELINE